MQPDDMAIGIYNHIRLAGGGYRASARGEIGGIPLIVSRHRYAGKHNFAITRPDEDGWSMKFVVVSADEEEQYLWFRRPDKQYRFRVSADGDTGYIRGKGRVYARLGSYEAYKRDMALLRMFDSVWGESCL